MMPHSKLSEAELSQDLFATIDLTQSFNRHRSAVRNARRQTRTRGFVPRRKSRKLTQLAHFTLAHADFDQRTTHRVLFRSLPPGTKVAEIVGSRSINNELNTTTRGDRLQLAVQL